MWKALLARLVSGSLLIYTGISGLVRFPSEFRDSATTLQRATELGVLAYGLAGTAAAIALLLRRPWTVRAATAWAVAVTFTGALAPVAFGGAAPWVALVAGGLSALVGAAVVWLARLGLRGAAEHSNPGG